MKYVVLPVWVHCGHIRSNRFSSSTVLSAHPPPVQRHRTRFGLAPPFAKLRTSTPASTASIYSSTCCALPSCARLHRGAPVKAGQGLGHTPGIGGHGFRAEARRNFVEHIDRFGWDSGGLAGLELSAFREFNDQHGSAWLQSLIAPVYSVKSAELQELGRVKRRASFPATACVARRRGQGSKGRFEALLRAVRSSLEKLSPS